MTKQEFLSALSEKLREGMTSSQIISQVRYYEGYIDGDVARGKTEEEAVADLGDPILIARNILESPREEEETIFGSSPQDQQDAYEEGSYQGENQHSEAEVKRAAREEIPLGETSEPDFTEESQETEHYRAREEQTGDRDNRKKQQQASEDRRDGNIPIRDGFEEDEMKEPEHDTASEDLKREFERAEAGFHEQDKDDPDDEPSGSGIFRDSKGHFRWDLLGVILAFVLGITAVIWIVTKIVSALNPVVIIILLVVIIAVVLIRLRS